MRQVHFAGPASLLSDLGAHPGFPQSNVGKFSAQIMKGPNNEAFFPAEFAATCATLPSRAHRKGSRKTERMPRIAAGAFADLYFSARLDTELAR